MAGVGIGCLRTEGGNLDWFARSVCAVFGWRAFGIAWWEDADGAELFAEGVGRPFLGGEHLFGLCGGCTRGDVDVLGGLGFGVLMANLVANEAANKICFVSSFFKNFERIFCVCWDFYIFCLIFH